MELSLIHISRPQVFADFLYQNTRLEKGAVEKDKYGFLERENGVWSVSYTHLDVYKRQQ